MKPINMLLAFAVTLVSTGVFAQKTYTVDASNAMAVPKAGHLKMGNPGTKNKIEINNLYLTIGGKPALPIMGEMHFSRINRDRWEDCILKMKANGIDIISTYLFWNQHEEIEGQFDWDGCKDIRAFVELCAKHGMYAYLRLGPWSHGEARNGGTPDWVLLKKYIHDRSNDIVYQTYVKRYFAQIAHQLEGLYYKDGGNIIGIQLENEYWYAKDGEPHIRWLKELAMGLGIDVPMYSVTGWGGGSVPQYEVIPMWGGYADAPWAEHVSKEYQPENFMFDDFRDNKNIGNDQIARKDAYMTYEMYPYFTCEIGMGVQNTYHRRLNISPIDGLGMITAKLGSGSNMLGYYVFAGATQFRGQLHSTGEEQEETGYWSRTPGKSYDFQAAIRESGELAESYKQLKKLHYFVNEFGADIAPMMPVVYRGGKDELQLSVRSDNERGYLFGINYARYFPKPLRKGSRFEIRLKNETIVFPQKGVDIADGTIFIWPFNFKMGKVTLKYATAQLMCTVDGKYVFFQNRGVAAEFAFSDATELTVTKGRVSRKNGLSIVSDLKAGTDCEITVRAADGSVRKIVLLTEEQANDSWLMTRGGRKELYITDANMYCDDKDISIFSDKNSMRYYRLNDGYSGEVELPAKKNEIKIKPVKILDEAKWLISADFDKIEPYQERYRRFFFKEFSLDNPSPFRKATLYVYPETDCELNVNDMWVRQEIVAGKLNVIDITGYVKKGENKMFVGFEYVKGQKCFAAKVSVEYSNYDRVGFSTDESWVTLDMYTNPARVAPSNFKAYGAPVAPKVAVTPPYAQYIVFAGFAEWDIDVPYSVYEGVNNAWIHVNYRGDRAELYNGYTLSADDFNANMTWSIGLNRQERPIEGRTMRMVIYPLSEKTKVFMDNPVPANGYNKAKIDKFEVVYEYKTKID